eukprot:Blabericola_migrator_1__9705@NODE_530_length_7799_cov_81_595447_g404_i0_p2_GENE_NODE_530_length_7799_cov_81_595447_g404_i0NODE_530_length_7799_cov_81_595447_g404_i0_p2_ORF_typecomplete_len609_score73_38_NODE_530_length_7799_cov_81_595447_g404_i038385664
MMQPRTGGDVEDTHVLEDFSQEEREDVDANGTRRIYKRTRRTQTETGPFPPNNIIHTCVHYETGCKPCSTRCLCLGVPTPIMPGDLTSLKASINRGLRPDVATQPAISASLTHSLANDSVTHLPLTRDTVVHTPVTRSGFIPHPVPAQPVSFGPELTTQIVAPDIATVPEVVRPRSVSKMSLDVPPPVNRLSALRSQGMARPPRPASAKSLSQKAQSPLPSPTQTHRAVNADVLAPSVLQGSGRHRDVDSQSVSKRFAVMSSSAPSSVDSSSEPVSLAINDLRRRERGESSSSTTETSESSASLMTLPPALPKTGKAAIRPTWTRSSSRKCGRSCHTSSSYDSRTYYDSSSCYTSSHLSHTRRHTHRGSMKHSNATLLSSDSHTYDSRRRCRHNRRSIAEHEIFDLQVFLMDVKFLTPFSEDLMARARTRRHEGHSGVVKRRKRGSYHLGSILTFPISLNSSGQMVDLREMLTLEFMGVRPRDCYARPAAITQIPLAGAVAQLLQKGSDYPGLLHQLSVSACVFCMTVSCDCVAPHTLVVEAPKNTRDFGPCDFYFEEALLEPSLTVMSVWDPRVEICVLPAKPKTLAVSRHPCVLAFVGTQILDTCC